MRLVGGSEALVLAGRKTFSSGVRRVGRALVAADGEAGWQMLLLAT